MRSLLCGVACALLACPVFGQDLVYTPVNPSFGGNPLNSSHLQGIASAQRNATAFDYQAPEAPGTDPSNDRSQTDLFVAQLQSRLLSSLSAQVVDAIFGDDPQESGSVVFGTTTIDFSRGADAITLVIADALDGTVTEISVPLLIAN